MATPSRSTTPSTASATAWLLNLATRILAHSLNMPQPLLHDTGAFVYAQVQAADYRAAKSLCPVRLLGWLQALLRRAG